VTAEPRASLATIALLADLRPPDLEQLERKCTWQRCDAGELILGQDDRGNDVIFVVAGRLKVQLFSASGQQVIFREIEAGDMLGELSAIDDKPRSASVLAATDSLIARLTAEAFWQLLDQHRTVRVVMLRKLVATIRDLSERVFEVSTLKARGRVRAHLLRLAQQAGVSRNQAEIRPVPVQSDMADQLATHREAVSREMSALIRGGILRREAEFLLVRDVRRLEILVEAQKAE